MRDCRQIWVRCEPVTGGCSGGAGTWPWGDEFIVGGGGCWARAERQQMAMRATGVRKSPASFRFIGTSFQERQHFTRAAGGAGLIFEKSGFLASPRNDKIPMICFCEAVKAGYGTGSSRAKRPRDAGKMPALPFTNSVFAGGGARATLTCRRSLDRRRLRAEPR